MNQKTLRTMLYIGAGAAVLWYTSSTARETVAAVADGVNPTSRTNVANRAFNGVTQSITQDDESIGVKLAKWLNPGPGAP